mmetsp:Transcript_19039/g.50041  ORF Transcript_19039/g.50041 Transcript_19039/m.50041 type:complete len:81 (+) Transcript_19039:240-482(+)
MLRRAQRRVAAPLSPCRRAKHISSCSSRDLRAHAHRTVTRVWSMSMTCTGACLGERGLVAIDKHTDRKQTEPRRALSPTL